jgi:hypothetical protein
MSRLTSRYDDPDWYWKEIDEQVNDIRNKTREVDTAIIAHWLARANEDHKTELVNKISNLWVDMLDNNYGLYTLNPVNPAWTKP